MRHYLVNLRMKQNESQQDVANALKISRQYYAMIENGERQKRMDLMLVTMLANHFGISPVEIIEQEATIHKEEAT